MLKSIACSVFICLFSFNLFGKPADGVKQKIFEELTLLQQDLQVADSLIRELQQDNLKMQQNLKALENWGVVQQEEKEKYYEELLTFENKLDETRKQVDLEKIKQKELLEKYRRVKQIFGYICGALFLFLYFTAGTTIVKNFSTLLGVWSPLLYVVSPLLSFGFGYFLIYLIF